MTGVVPRFAETAAQLVEHGYEPLPIHFGQKRPCAGEQWQHYRFKPEDAARFAEAGTGLLCGKVIGLDIDVRDVGLVALLEALAERSFGHAPRRIGQSPKVLWMLQAEVPFSTITTRGFRLDTDSVEDEPHRVRFLAKGQQFVCYNQHPDTARPYEWNGAGEPLQIPISLLPCVSEFEAHAYIAEADALLARHGRPVRSALSDEELADKLNDWAEGQSERDAIQAESESPSPLANKSGHDSAKTKDYDELADRTARVAAEEWPEPVNLFAEMSASAFDADELPPELSAYPALYAAQTGIDRSIMMTAAVSVAAAAIPDQIQLCADSESEWFAQPRLWFLVIGAPGAGKSPGQRAMLAPLWKLHSELDAEWRQGVAALKRAESEDPEPPRPRVIVADATLEALSDVLLDNPRGILVATDEFDSWIGGMDQYKSGGIGRDRGEWLRLFDGGPHTVERVKRGSVFVPNWGASILTATTPAAMRRLTRHLPEDGLIQRFIPVLAARQVVDVEHRPERAEIEAERARYVETIRRLWGLAPRAHKGVVSLSFEARQRFDKWRRENQTLQEAFGTLDPALESHIAKYPTLALRLALTFHCAAIVQLQDERARDPAAWPIPAVTLELALRFLDRASRHAMALYLGRKGGSDVFELARDVAKLLLARTVRENDGGVQRREVWRRCTAFRDADEVTQAAALRLLVDLGWLRDLNTGYQKGHVTRFAVHPLLNQKFAALAERERERRAVVRERIAQSVDDRREKSGE